MTTTTTTDPQTALEKLAAIIPAPDAPEKTQVPAEAEASIAVSGGGPAPPLHTLQLDEKPTAKSRRKPPQKQNAAEQNAAKRAVQKMLPAAVRVHVYKRNRTGKMAFVSDYSANDLQEQGTMERFISEYVVPEYEYGEYALYLQSPGKELAPLGSVVIEEPISHKKRGNGGDTKELVELFLAQQQGAQQRAATQKDPLDQMRETMTFLQNMNGNDKEKSSMDPMMLMLMMQNMSRPAPPPGPDPLMLKIIDRLERMDDERMTAAMLPPPPLPPMPVADPMEGFAAMMKVLADQNAQNTAVLIEAMKSREPRRDPVEDIARLTALTGASDDRMTTKDFLTMLPTIKGLVAPNKETNSLAEALDTMRSVKLLEREFGGNQDSEGSSNFWAFLRDFITSDAGAKLAEAVTAQQASASVEQRHQQRQLAAQNVVNQEVEEEQGDGSLVIPDSFRNKHAMEINNAADTPTRLRALIQGLQHLGMHPEFRPYVAKVFGMAAKNKRIETLDFLGQFLDGLIEAGAIEEDAARKCVENLQDFWDLTRKTLGMPDIPEEFPEGYEPEEQASGEYEIDDSEDGDEVDPPRRVYRDPIRDVEIPRRQLIRQDPNAYAKPPPSPEPVPEPTDEEYEPEPAPVSPG